MQTHLKLFKAIIWDSSSEASGERVTVLAESLAAARTQLEEKHGKDTVYDLHCQNDAEKSR